MGKEVLLKASFEGEIERNYISRGLEVTVKKTKRKSLNIIILLLDPIF